MKTQKIFSTAVVTFAFVMSLVAGGCSSKKANTDSAAIDTSAMQPTQVAQANVKLGKGSSGRAR